MLINMIAAGREAVQTNLSPCMREPAPVTRATSPVKSKALGGAMVGSIVYRLLEQYGIQ